MGVELGFPSLHSKLFTDHISPVLDLILMCVCKDLRQLAFLQQADSFCAAFNHGLGLSCQIPVFTQLGLCLKHA